MCASTLRNNPNCHKKELKQNNTGQEMVSGNSVCLNMNTSFPMVESRFAAFLLEAPSGFLGRSDTEQLLRNQWINDACSCFDSIDVIAHHFLIATLPPAAFNVIVFFTLQRLVAKLLCFCLLQNTLDLTHTSVCALWRYT